ncbi:MAG: hypothetical protein Tp1111DCM603221_38 [Prokaryotic dsDNA virus sp.]|nr:MAG: hypothetical protein Tp1111DCM603221_38 [Prokaryotic dsDNA virus sp.]|tara:strand:+ start:2305 stop:3573 length:1269 start_codon:yes stop_codon:yes gene_type:complete
MNLAEMRSMVGSIVDYDPNVQTYRDEVNRILNELYLDFFTDRPWKFAQETEEVQVYRDVTVTNVSIAAGNNTVTVAAGTPFLSWMEGAIVEIQGAADVDNGEYEIIKVTPTVLYLDNFSASASPGGLTVTVKQRFIDMPEDCSEVLAIGIRSPTSGTQAHFDYLSRARDEELSLLLSSTGLPTDWLIYDDVTMTQPVLQPVLDADSSGTRYSTVGTYHVHYTFVHKNKESAPSPVASATATTGSWQLDLSNIQNTGANSGIFKRFYLKTTTNSAFYQVTNADIDELAMTIDDLNVAADHLVNARRLPENDGHYKRVRLYPRQDTDYLVEVRFVYRPDRLIEDTDVPEFPPDHHRYLVYRACQELFVKHDNLQHSELYRRKADAELVRIQNLYLSEGAGYWIKQGYRETTLKYQTSTSLTHRG